MAYVDQVALAADSIFRKRVKEAMITAATQVQSEATATANDTNRSNYAKLVLNNPDNYLEAFCQAVVSNAAITAASLDSDIQFQVNAVFTDLAGRI